MVVDGPEPARLQQLTEDSLPDGDVTVAVGWSSLDYKDELAVTGPRRRRCCELSVRPARAIALIHGCAGGL